jgi:(carboxyethyl)arginine beta-lactam-synthase
MDGTNVICGFRVRVGSPGARPRPALIRFASQGREVPVLDGRGPMWTGVAVSLGTAPTVVAADRVRLLLAGEIYNRDRVAAALGDRALEFGTDADLVLAAWAHWGVSAFRMFNGRFAALLDDQDSGVVVVATDHAGTVPLWVRADVDALDVATEIKTLVGAGPGGRRLAGAEHQPDLPGVHRVPAGTALVIRGVGSGPVVAEPVRTWTPPLSRTLPDEDTAVSLVGTRLAEAVRTRLRGAATPTVVLSGGIDSSGVAAHAVANAEVVHSISMGTDVSDEFAAAAAVARHLGTDHRELVVPGADLVRELPWAVWAAETTDHTILEYLLPLVALYRRLGGGPRRVLTGYGADIPLGGMHRLTTHLAALDGVIAGDMATFDGLNEMSPVLSGVAGIWSTHPYWDRDVLDVLVSLEPGLKRRHGRDKWVLRQALSGLLPEETVRRPKLGIHEGSGTTSQWTAELLAVGVPADRLDRTKRQMTRRIHELVVLGGEHPDDVSFDEVLLSIELDTRSGKRAVS